MSSNLDKSLDDIVKSGRSRGGFKRNTRNSQPYNKNELRKGDSSKIIINNLHYNVTESDLRELFSCIGAVKKASLNFNPDGKSKGSGEVTFINPNDCIKAFKKYHKVTLDGRPMHIEVPIDPTKVSNLNLSRVSRSVSNLNFGRVSRSSRGRGFRNGRGRRGGRGGRRRDNRESKTAEELDAEMTTYMEGSNNADNAMTDA